jgi:hypothetical protein
MVIGTCKINDGKSCSRFRNAETNTESATAENGKASSSLKVSSPEKQEYPALTKFFHRKFLKGHGVELDRVNPGKNDADFTVHMPEQLKCGSVTRGAALETENSSLSSTVSGGDCNDFASPCCMNECCSPSSTITSGSSDPSANCKTDSRCKYSKPPELKFGNGINDETADQNICSNYLLGMNESTKKMEDVDNILLGNLNTSGASKLENKHIETDDGEGQRMPLLNLDLSAIKDDDNSSNDSKQSKCWKSPEEVRLGYGRVAALAKHFSRLGDSGLIRIRGREEWRGRSGAGLWTGVFRSVPDVSRICLKKESNWNCSVPLPQMLPQLDCTDSNSRSHVYNVGLGAISYSVDHLLLGDSSEDLGVQDQYKSCEEFDLQDNKYKSCEDFDLQDNRADFNLTGSGDKEFEKVARQFQAQKRTRGHKDALHSGHTRSEENGQVQTEMGLKGSQLQCCDSSSNCCMQGAQHEVSGAKHRAFIILASRGTPVTHSKSEGSIISAIPCVGSSVPLFIAERPRSEDNILKAGISNGDAPLWYKEIPFHTATENNLKACFKSESAVLPSQTKLCGLVDCRPKSEDNILLFASAQDNVYLACGGNDVKRTLEPQAVSVNCTNKEPEYSGCGRSVLTRCKQ